MIEVRVLLRRSCFLLLIAIAITGSALADPFENIKEVGTFNTEDPHDGEFSGDYFFIADGNSVIVYNTSNPEKPKRVKKFRDFNRPGNVYGISISGNILYTAAGPGWIYLVNISDPENPKILHQINYLNSANDVAIAGKYMYVADSNTGVLIFDLGNMRKPVLVGRFYILRSNMSGTLQGWGGISVEVTGNYAILSGAQRKGLYIIDVSDPGNPKEISRSSGKTVYDIDIFGEDVYLARADGSSRFDLLDISNPYSTSIIGNFSIIESVDRSAIAIHPSGDYIYAASGDTWHIFRIPDIIQPQIVIDQPGDNETTATGSILISGKAFDKSGIMEVLVNGKPAGKETWEQLVKLEEGQNRITIKASDNNGNDLTKEISVIYSPGLNLTTPSPTDISPPITGTEEELLWITKIVVYISAIVIVLIILIYLFYRIRK